MWRGLGGYIRREARSSVGDSIVAPRHPRGTDASLTLTPAITPAAGKHRVQLNWFLSDI
jgi:hypothetical protein